MEDWKIERRKSGCTVCGRPFDSEERHLSAIFEADGRFQRRDQCLCCWEKRAEEPFSFWYTVAPKREQRRLEDVAAMVEFFKKLTAQPPQEETRSKVAYLTALLLMRKRRLKAVGSKTRESRAWLVLEKAWDGETVEIVDPPIADPELETLKLEMERLFDLELGQEALLRA
ncbi:MAG: hypothetical protein HYY16_10580 [Planctomycetes bacterium]|nr:hypothetical protein [Planctomycetota bacterium]